MNKDGALYPLLHAFFLSPCSLLHALPFRYALCAMRFAFFPFPLPLATRALRSLMFLTSIFIFAIMRLHSFVLANLFPGFHIQASTWNRHFDARRSVSLSPADHQTEESNSKLVTYFRNHQTASPGHHSGCVGLCEPQFRSRRIITIIKSGTHFFVGRIKALRGGIVSH